MLVARLQVVLLSITWQGSQPQPSARTLLVNVERCLAECHDELLAMDIKGPKPGSTIVALLVFDHYFACVWAGDSRLYRRRDGRLDQLTRDHSVLQEMSDAGLPSSNRVSARLTGRITRSVGASGKLALESRQGTITDRDRFLLCSDGLNRTLNDQEIQAIVQHQDIEYCANQLIEKSLEKGASDNITVVIVDVKLTDEAETL